MPKIKPRFLIIGLLIVGLALYAYFQIERHKRDHFDSQVWKKSIDSRWDTGFPEVHGKHTAQIIEILGRPELEYPDSKKPSDTSYVYLMPMSGNPYAYYIEFHNDVAVHEHVDDSAADVFEEYRDKKRGGNKNTTH
jgi:hypothetical protein